MRPRVVSVAVLLGLLLGPFGLWYSTTTGMIVMLLAAVILRFLMGYLSLVIILPICAFWAWRAAREQSSAFD